MGAKEITAGHLVVGFRKAKTIGSPWCYLSKIKRVLGVSDRRLEQLIRDLKAGRVSRRVNDYTIAFERDISRYKTYAGVNLVTIYRK